MPRYSLTKVVAILVIGLFFFPAYIVRADDKICLSHGFTVLTINGIFTDEANAKKNKDDLSHLLPEFYNKESINIKYLLNPSHLGGIGDIIKAIEQKIFDNETVDDYDLIEMIRDASEKVGTQKLLLVAHSQGNFYANGLYDTVVEKTKEVPSESIGIYGVANPASRVAGGGKYLTSDTDRVIAGVVAHTPFRAIMPPNTHIELKDGDSILGHDFSQIYLKYRGAQIVSDIEAALDTLKTNTARDETKPCIAAPAPTVAHKIAGAFFAIADPAAGAGIALVSDVARGTSAVGLAVANFLGGPTTQLAAVEAARGVSADAQTLGRTAKDATNFVAAVGSDLLGRPAKEHSQILENTRIEQKQVTTEVAPPPPPVAAAPVPVSETHTPAPPQFRLSPPGGGGGGVSNPAPVEQPTTNNSPPTTTIETATSTPASSASIAAPETSSTTATTTAGTATTTPEISPPASSPPPAAAPVAISPGSVVINEVAWSGTAANNAHEYIELYNPTGDTVSLASSTLFAADLSPYIMLSGTIAPHSYYLIEATDAAVSDIAADLVASFGAGLNDNGDQLTLAFFSGGATTTIDATPVCIGGGTQWCAGNTVFSNHFSMERYDAAVVGSDANNWLSHLGEFILNGHDANGAAIFGTPHARNSVSYLIAPASTLWASKTLTAAGSPYLVPRGGLTVASGVTLTLGAGTVVKIVGANSPSINVDGTLIANGTASAPVVFTSFADDSYGGDTNGDGSATTPTAGNWRRLYFSPASTGSSLTHTLVRYGGNNDISNNTARKGAVGVASSAVSFSHLTVEYSAFYGLALENSDSSVSDSLFRHNSNAATDGTGIYIEGGAPSITNSTMSDNRYGAVLTNAGGSFSNNTLSNNAVVALYATQIRGAISGNGGNGNGTNGIMLQGYLTVAGATTTLAANSLPYLLSGQVNMAGDSGLFFGNGVVVKGYDNSQYGELVVGSGALLAAEGSSPSDLVFTSIRDSSVGGATETGPSTASAGNWTGITVAAGGRLALSGFTLKYAGHRATNPFFGESAGALKVTGSASASSGFVAHALFSDNYQSGLNLASVSALSVSDAAFQNHTASLFGDATAIYSVGSTATFSGISFLNNTHDGP